MHTIDQSGTLSVKTYRSGHFKFEIGLDSAALALYRVLADNAYARFASMPSVGEIASKLEHMTLVSSIYSTNTIEGGDLSEEETESILALEPNQIGRDAERRIQNMKRAYGLTEYFAPKHIAAIQDSLEVEGKLAEPESVVVLALSEAMIQELHQIITTGLSHENNLPGQYRDNARGSRTQVGDKSHGGAYVPPKCLDDIKMLMDAFVTWANSDVVTDLPPLYRAPLVHYYFERIHPFWDGNGRTGRVLEAMILQAAGYNYAPYANARYYLDNFHEYFALFNACRKKAHKKEAHPNTEFVKFHLLATISSINRLHDKANRIIAKLLFDANLNFLYQSKQINDRQHAILTQLSGNPDFGRKEKLHAAPWYQSLYKKLSDTTKTRDINGLLESGLLEKTKQGDILIKFAMPEVILSESPVTAPEQW
jgi:Fic family protein